MLANEGAITGAHTTARPLELVVTIFAGDRNRIVYELGDLSADDADQ